jgi:hypothetical protein
MFFKLETNGFIICLGIILLLTGLIMFYVKQRFSVYDKIISEQNKLLKHVVASIEYSSLGGMQNASGLSNSIALQTAREISSRMNEDNTRISVSDDESSEEVYSESEEDESQSENSSENDASVESENEREIIKVDHSQTKILKISNLDYINNMHNDSSSSSIDNIDSDDDEDDTDESESNKEEMNDIESKLNIQDHFIKVIELTPDETDNDEGTKYVNSNSNTSEPKQESILSSTKLNVEEVHEDVKHSISKKIDLANNLAVSTLSGLKKTELESLCKDKNLSTKGRRLELIKRLTE